MSGVSPIILRLLRDLSLELEQLAQPLLSVARDPVGLHRLLARSGWDLERLVGVDVVRLASELTMIQADMARVAAAMMQPDDDQLVAEAYTRFKSAIDRLDGLYAIVQGIDPAVTLDAFSTATAEALGRDVAEQLLITYTARRMPKIFALARMFGLVVKRRAQPIYAQGDPDQGTLRHALERPAVDWWGLLSPSTNPFLAFMEIVDLRQVRSLDDLIRALGTALDTQFGDLSAALGRRGLDGMRVHLDHTGLSFIGGAWLPHVEVGGPPVEIELPASFAPKLTIDDERWRFGWLATAPTNAGEHVIVREEWIEITLVGSTPAVSASAGAPGIHLFEENGAPALEIIGGASIRFPLDVLTSHNGDALRGAVRGRLKAALNKTPELHLESLSLSGDLRLGGPGGLAIKNAAVEIGGLSWPVPDADHAKVDLAVEGELVLPGNQRVGVRVHTAPGVLELESTGELALGDGVRLHAVGGAPVLRAAWRRAGETTLAFSVKAAMDVPSADAASGVRRFTVEGQLELEREDDGTWSIASFLAGGTAAAAWSLPGGISLEEAALRVQYVGGSFEATLSGAVSIGRGGGTTRVGVETRLAFPDPNDPTNIEFDASVVGQAIDFAGFLQVAEATVDLSVRTRPSPSGTLRLRGAAGLLPDAGGAALLSVTAFDATFAFDATGWDLAVASGVLRLPEAWTLVDDTQPTFALGSAIAPFVLRFRGGRLQWYGAVTVEELGIALPGIGADGPHAVLETATLEFSSTGMPELSHAEGRISLPLPGDKELVVSFEDVAWALDGIPTGTLALAETLTVEVPGGFRLLLIADDDGSAPTTGVVIAREADGARVTIAAKLALEAPLQALSGEDGDAIKLEGAGSIVFPPDGLPVVQASRLALSGTLHLGGPDGIVVRNAELAVVGIGHVLAPTHQHPVVVSLSGSIEIPEGPTGTIEGATIEINGAEPVFDIAAIGVDASTMQLAEVLPISVNSMLLTFDPDVPFPEKLHPRNMTVTLGATVTIGDVLEGDVDDLTIGFDDAGLPTVSVDTVMVTVDGLEMGSFVLGGGLGIGGLTNPRTDLVIAGKLGGKLNGTGIEALAAFGMVDGVPAPLGAALDVSLGPGGIPLWATGILLTGVAGGVSFTGSNADPDDLRSYIQIDDDGKVLSQPIPEEGKPEPVPANEQVETARASSAPDAQAGTFVCPDAPCPPPSVGILYQPHPDRERFPNRTIVKFTSLDQPTVDALLGAANLDKNQLASYTPSRIAGDLRDAIFEHIGSSEFLAEQIDEIGDGIETTFREAIEAAIGDSIYDAIVQAAYRGIRAPNVTTKLTGTISYTGISSFASITGGVVLSPTVQSAGIVGSLNLLGIPVGKLRGFITLNNAAGNPDPAMCGDLTFGLGPLELGHLRMRATYGFDAVGFANAMVAVATSLPDAVLSSVLAVTNPDAMAQAGNDTHSALVALKGNDPTALVGVLSRIMQHPVAGEIEAFVLQLFDAVWDSFEPEWIACGSVHPKLFGLPLGPETVGAHLRITKSVLKAQFRFSPTQIISSALGGVIPPSDEMACGVRMELPHPRPLLAAGMFATLDDAAAVAARAEDALGHVLEHAVASIDYTFAPMGLPVGQLQARLIMPSLLAHPAAPGSGWQPPEDRGTNLPSRLEILRATLKNNVLSDVAWLGTPDELRALPDLPGASAITDESLRTDWFPYGGFLGAGRLAIPKLLADTPPVEDLRTLVDGSLPAGTRIAAAQALIGAVMEDREIGTIAFHVPAPSPPPAMLDGTPVLADIINHMRSLELDPEQLGVLPTYPLHEAFILGRLGEADAPLRLLGIPLGEADLELVPPAGGHRAHLRITASVPPNSWFRDFVGSASAIFDVHAPPDRPIKDRFAEIEATLNAGGMTPAAFIAALQSGLPHITLRVEVNDFNPPGGLAALVGIAGTASATIRACSPVPHGGPVPLDPVACVGELGGFVVSVAGSITFGADLGFGVQQQSLTIEVRPVAGGLPPHLRVEMLANEINLPFGLGSIIDAAAVITTLEQVVAGVRPVLFTAAGTIGSTSATITSQLGPNGIFFETTASIATDISVTFPTIKKPGTNVVLARGLVFSAALSADVDVRVDPREALATVHAITLSWQTRTIHFPNTVSLTTRPDRADFASLQRQIQAELKKDAWRLFGGILDDAMTWADLFADGVIGIGTTRPRDVGKVIASLTSDLNVVAKALVRCFEDLGDVLRGLHAAFDRTEVEMLDAVHDAMAPTRDRIDRLVAAAWNTFEAAIVEDLLQFLLKKSHTLQNAARKLMALRIDLVEIARGLIGRTDPTQALVALLQGISPRNPLGNLKDVVSALLDTGNATPAQVAVAVFKGVGGAGAATLAKEVVARGNRSLTSVAALLHDAGFSVRSVFDALRVALPASSVAATIGAVAGLASTSVSHLKELVTAVKQSSHAGASSQRLMRLVEGMLGTGMPSASRLTRAMRALKESWSSSADGLIAIVKAVMARIGTELLALTRIAGAVREIWGSSHFTSLAAAIFSQWSSPTISTIKRVCEAMYSALSGASSRLQTVANAVVDGWVGTSSTRARSLTRALIDLRGTSLSRLKEVAKVMAAVWGDGTTRLADIAKAIKAEVNSMTSTAKALRYALNDWSGSTTVRRVALAVFAAWGSSASSAKSLAEALKSTFSGASSRFEKVVKALKGCLGDSQSDAERIIKVSREVWRSYWDQQGFTKELETITSTVWNAWADATNRTERIFNALIAVFGAGQAVAIQFALLAAGATASVVQALMNSL